MGSHELATGWPNLCLELGRERAFLASTFESIRGVFSIRGGLAFG